MPLPSIPKSTHPRGAGSPLVDSRMPRYQQMKARLHQELLKRLNLERLTRTKREDAEPEIRQIVNVMLDKEAATTPLAELLRIRTLAESPAGFGWEASEKERTLRAARPRGAQVAVVVLCDQPMYENFVVILVYDPAARGRQKVQATVHESICEGGLNGPGTPATLEETGHETGIFMGRAEIEGSHSTRVQVRYVRVEGKIRDPKPVTYASDVSSMAFH